MGLVGMLSLHNTLAAGSRFKSKVAVANEARE